MSKFARNGNGEVPKHIQCAHDGCPHSAIIAMWMPNVTRLCKAHYEFHISRFAKDFCDSKGLITRTQKREWCKENMPASFRTVMRQPGEEG